jgi:hypothetical protein
VIDLYISILEENQNELIEIINFIIDFNSNKGIEKGFLFKITGNQYTTSFIRGLISKDIVSRRIEHEPCLLGEILFDIYEARGVKYLNRGFMINGMEFEVIDDHLNLYFLIARLSLDDGENNLLKEFEEKIKSEKSDSYEFNFYFSNRELGLFEKIDTRNMREITKFKDFLKANDFHLECYYDYKEFTSIFKKELESLALKEYKNVIKERKKVMNKLANSNLTDIFYSFVVLEKYGEKRVVSEKEKEYIDRFLTEEQYSINKFNQEFGQNSFQETVKFIINEGIANPNEEEFDNVMDRLVEYYEEKDFTRRSTEKLGEYLKDNGILENGLNIENYKAMDLDEFGLFNILKLRTSENIYPILEYLKKKEDSELNNLLKKIHDDLDDVLGNSYLLYITSFFHDLKPELELLRDYYINLLDNGVIDQFYHDEWENDEMDNIDEEDLLKKTELKSIEEEFIISTNDFLEEWNSYYKLFRGNILQKEDNLKFIDLLILSMGKDNLGMLDRNTLNLKLLIDHILGEIDEVIKALDDLKFLNDHLENLKGKEMKEQYDTIRKFINKWRRNVSSFKKTCKTHLMVD